MTPELVRRMAFTLGALLVFRLGTYIPLPGFNGAVLRQLLADGGIHRAAIFSLNVLPYLAAAIIVQLAMLASRRLRAVRKRGALGRAIVERWTGYVAVLLAALQGWGLAAGFQSIPGVAADPGGLFVITAAATLTAGTMFLVWLSAQITRFGVGNGLALMLVAGYLTDLPAAIAGTLEVERQGLLSENRLLALGVIVVAAVALVVLIEQGRRHIPVRYAKRQIGAVTLAEHASPFSLKINNAGVMPVILANWLLAMLLVGGGLGAPGLASLASRLGPGRPLYLIFFVLLVVLGVFFYTAFVLDPDESAGSLQQHGGSIAGIEPGEATAAHIDAVVSRITLIGAVYLAVVCVLPTILIMSAGVPFVFGGPSLLVVVCTMLDLAGELRGYGIGPRG